MRTAAATAANFRLYDLGGYPGLVAAALGGRCVEGEVWEVDPRCRDRLDRLEGTAEGLYARRRLVLRPPLDGLAVEAYLYCRGVLGRPDLGTRFDH